MIDPTNPTTRTEVPRNKRVPVVGSWSQPADDPTTNPTNWNDPTSNPTTANRREISSNGELVGLVGSKKQRAGVGENNRLRDHLDLAAQPLVRRKVMAGVDKLDVVKGTPGKPESTLERTPFTTSRLLEFFTEKELTMEIGWPLALVRELIDNALDACDNAGVAPAIRVVVEPDAVSVVDNGPGLPTPVLEKSLDYNVRISDKSHYVSPTRGQLGNALKCVWAAPFVADGTCGRVEVEMLGARHVIDVTLNRIAQEPQLRHQQFPSDGLVKSGTLLRMRWPKIASFLDGPAVTIFTTSPCFCAPTPRLTLMLACRWRAPKAR